MKPYPNRYVSSYQERTSLELRARMKDFVAFLQAGRALIVDPASQWELLRYAAWDATQPDTAKRPMTHVIYHRNDGTITFNGRSYMHWNLFIAGSPFPEQRADWTMSDHGKKISWSRATRKLLHERDGDNCCICGDPLTHMNGDKQRGGETIEHWLAKRLGGTNHIDNLKLAHAKCNRDVGHRTPEQKEQIAAMYKAGLISNVPHWGGNPRPRKRPGPRCNICYLVNGVCTGCGRTKLGLLGQPKSPCVGVCKMKAGRCIGCNRTLAQIEEAGK